MTIAALAPTAHAVQSARMPEAKEGPGPDHDGDSDDTSVGAANATGVTASAPKGMGAVVDTSA